MTLTILQPDTEDQFDDFRNLVREFFGWAMATLVDDDTPIDMNAGPFATLDKELAELPGKFGPPDGCILIAYVDNQPAGCVGFFRRDEKTMEVKRMYVRPEFRGHKIGENLLAELLTRASDMSYRRYLLSSHKSMASAHAIYRKAGFSEVAWTKTDFPLDTPDLAIFMEMLPSAV